MVQSVADSSKESGLLLLAWDGFFLGDDSGARWLCQVGSGFTVHGLVGGVKVSPVVGGWNWLMSASNVRGSHFRKLNMSWFVLIAV